MVLESCGTMTVVLFAGAGGLLLLIHPVISGITRNRLIRIFMFASSRLSGGAGCCLFYTATPRAQRPATGGR